MAEEDDMPICKCVLVGDGCTGEFGKRYIATLDVEIHPLVLHANRGPIRINVCVTATTLRDSVPSLCLPLHREFPTGTFQTGINI